MPNLISTSITAPIESFYQGCVDVKQKMEKGVLAVAEEGSYFLYNVYSVEGLEKLAKAVVADAKILALLQLTTVTFNNFIKHHEFLKDVYYGTAVFRSTPDFIRVIPNGSKKWIIPKRGNSQDWDYSKIFLGIGNVAECGYILKKYELMSFPLCSKIASQIGSTKLFSLNVQIKDVPVLSNFCSRPKEFFVFLASLDQTYQFIKRPDYSIEGLVKLVGNIGKMVLIGLSKFMIARNLTVALAVIDVITQNASLFSLPIKRYNERVKYAPQVFSRA